LSPSNAGTTFTDLGHASDWLHFAGAFGALVAVSIVVREIATKQQQQQSTALWEVAGAAVSTLLIAIGSLVNAASSSSASTANIIAAVGVGGWALLVFSRVARSSGAAQGTSAANPQAMPWLMASAGLLLLAVGSGFNVDVTNKGVGVASGLIEAIGVGALTLALVTARNQNRLGTRPVPLVIGGLGLVTLFFLGTAVVAGIVFSPNPSLTGLRAGVALVTTLELVGVAVLGLAAWTRVNEIAVPAASAAGGFTTAPQAPGTPYQSPGMQPPGSAFAAPTVAPAPGACANCGAALPVGSNVCQQCGTVAPTA